MARMPEVFVRELSIEEGRRLQRVARTSKQPVRLRRAAIVLASAARRPVPDLAELFQVSQGYVRRVIHEFNEHGFGALDPKWSSGPSRRISAGAREEICRIARCKPQELGLPLTVWSLSKLRDYLLQRRVVAAVSREKLRQILREHGVTWQATKTWKAARTRSFGPSWTGSSTFTTIRLPMAG